MPYRFDPILFLDTTNYQADMYLFNSMSIMDMPVCSAELYNTKHRRKLPRGISTLSLKSNKDFGQIRKCSVSRNREFKEREENGYFLHSLPPSPVPKRMIESHSDSESSSKDAFNSNLNRVFRKINKLVILTSLICFSNACIQKYQF